MASYLTSVWGIPQLDVGLSLATRPGVLGPLLPRPLDAFEPTVSLSGACVGEFDVHGSNQARQLYEAADYDSAGQDCKCLLVGKARQE